MIAAHQSTLDDLTESQTYISISFAPEKDSRITMQGVYKGLKRNAFGVWFVLLEVVHANGERIHAIPSRNIISLIRVGA